MASRTRALLAAVPLALTLAASGAGIGVGTAQAAVPTAPPVLAKDTFTLTPLLFRVEVGAPGARRTCTVDADLRVPDGLTAPAPSLLMSNGFGGSKSDTGPNGNGAYAARFAELGYVTLSYSALGFARSNDCDISVIDPLIDGQAGSALVSFLGGDPSISVTSGGTPYTSRPPVVHDAVDQDGVAQTYDPRVGMIGGSYGGQIQFAIAGIDHRVDTIAPIYTWNQLEYSLAPNNALAPTDGLTDGTPGAAKFQWQNIFGALGEAQLPNRPVGTPVSTCPGTRAEVCRANVDGEAPGYPSDPTRDFFGSVSVGDYLDDIVVPVLLSQGQNDTLFNLQEAVATYRGLLANGVETRMVWQSWGHSGSAPRPGELNPGTLTPGSGTLEQTVQGEIFINWFAHWLRDVPNDLGPAVRYYRDYAYTAPAATDPASRYLAVAAAYGSATSYPVGAPTALRLSGGGDLVGTDTPVLAGTQTFAQPGGQAGTSYSETAVAGPLLPPTDTAGTFASWTTGPLTAPLDVAGVPELTVRLQAPAAAAAQATGPAGQLVLYAKLYDVAPDGSRSLVNGLISPVRVADVTKPVRIELPGIVHRYDTGHSLVLVLAAGDSAYHGNVLADTVTIVDDPANPSVLSLPLENGVAAPPPVVPEVPVAVLLPLLAAGLLGAAAVRRRRTA